jgi:hypothetical protein
MFMCIYLSYALVVIDIHPEVMVVVSASVMSFSFWADHLIWVISA